MKLVILNRFPDVILPLLGSLKKFDLKSQDVIVVRDSHQIDYGYLSIDGPEPFIFSRSANLGINAAGQDDVLLVNDDAVFVQPEFFSKLESITKSLPKRVGILGALVDGGVGTAMQKWPAKIEDWGSGKLYFVPQPVPVCFVCVWLRRAMLDDIGPLDESYVQYGFEDNDTCIRARLKGWSCAISSEIYVRHGCGGSANMRGENWSKSFARVDPGFQRDNGKIFREKYSLKSSAAKS